MFTSATATIRASVDPLNAGRMMRVISPVPMMPIPMDPAECSLVPVIAHETDAIA
jgi:hypothetical protein